LGKIAGLAVALLVVGASVHAQNDANTGIANTNWSTPTWMLQFA